MRRLLALFLLVCLCAPVAAQPLLDRSSPFLRDLLTWHPVLPGLVGSRWYDLADGAQATMVGTWAWKGDPTARFAGVLSVAGAGYAEIPATGAHNFSVSDPFSLSLWMASTNTTGEGHLWNKALPDGTFQGYYLFVYADGRISFYILADDGSDIGVQTTAGWNDGRLHHVVATYNGTGLAEPGMRLYVDGVDRVVTGDCAVCDINTGNILNTAPTRMGSNPDATKGLVGSLTNVLVYNRALALADVQALAQMQAPDYGGLLLEEPLALVQSAPATPGRKHKGTIQ